MCCKNPRRMRMRMMMWLEEQNSTSVSKNQHTQIDFPLKGRDNRGQYEWTAKVWTALSKEAFEAVHVQLVAGRTNKACLDEGLCFRSCLVRAIP